MRNRVSVLSGLVAAVAAAASAGEEPPVSLTVGDEVSTFFVKDVTGPAAGKELCYRCRYADQPVVAVFTRKITGEVAALLDEIDALVDENAEQDLAAFVVLMDDDPALREDELKRLAREHGLDNVPLTTFDDEYGPRSYRLTRDAEVTVMMWVGGKVQVNSTFAAEELSEESIADLVAETAKILK